MLQGVESKHGHMKPDVVQQGIPVVPFHVFFFGVVKHIYFGSCWERQLAQSCGSCRFPQQRFYLVSLGN